MTNDYVALTINNNIAHLELTREGARNALDRIMVDKIADAVDHIVDNRALRGLMITARGPAFCVGGDLPHFVSHFDALKQELKHMIVQWHRTLLQLHTLPIPVVVGIHGGSAGGGLGIVWVADHVIAADNTKIALGFADLGVTGDGGNSWYLPQLIGMRRAKELMLENRILDAKTAVEWGLINQAVEKKTLLDKVYEKVTTMSQRSLTAYAGIKQNLVRSSQVSYADQLNAELMWMLNCTDKQDVRLGMKAFTEGKKPTFIDTY